SPTERRRALARARRPQSPIKRARCDKLETGVPCEFSRGIIVRFGYDGAPMVASDLFRQVMGNFATGITIVTTRDAKGKPYGLTVNSFTSVSLDPVLVLVCLDNKLSGLQSFKESKHFGISVLSEHQEDLSRMFAKKDSERLPNIYFEGKLG